jgi:DNA excision repair protein ERCC-5
MQTQLRMEAFYSFNERFAKIRSKRIKKAIKGITGKSFLDADESEQDNPSTSKTIKKKEASSSSHARGREKRKNDYGVMGSQEDNIIDNTNSLAETVENTRENNNTTKIKRGSSCGRPKGRGRSRTTAGSDATINQEDYEIEYSTSASDEDSCKRHSNSYGSEGRALRRVSFSYCIVHSLSYGACVFKTISSSLPIHISIFKLHYINSAICNAKRCKTVFLVTI